MYDQPHNSEAGPSSHNGHTNFHTHKPSPLGNIPRISVGTGPSSAPAAIPSFDEEEEEPLDVIPSRAGRKLCVRHKQMANQNVNEKLQKSLDNLATPERSAVTQLWSTFSNAPHAKRKLILEGILTMCCFSQLSHLSDSLNQIIRIDPFSLLPREINLRILGYLDAITLGRAAQVSRSWKALADDDLIWRRMCGQHIDRKCEKCGWGLPLLERRRLKVELNERSPAVALGVGEHVHNHENGHGHEHKPSAVATRDEALAMNGGSALASAFAGPQGGSKSCDDILPSMSPSTAQAPSPVLGKRQNLTSASIPSAKKMKLDGSDSEGEGSGLTRQVRLTRPWKSVYCERLVVERNWRKGRCKTTTLKGHEDGIMCLQYHTALSSPSYPVLITGSYDRTVRVWNLDSGDCTRVLRGHTRAVRCLQFDQMLLFTGAMDGTVRMWNWRAGECLRVLEGHSDGVLSVSYNGYLLASGSADTTIQLWNFRTGSKFVLRGHDDRVNSVLLWDGKTSPGDMDPMALPTFKFSSKKPAGSTGEAGSVPDSNGTNGHPSSRRPDFEPGAMLFSASGDETIKLWDLETQECIRTFEGHKAHVQSLKVLMVDMTGSEMAKKMNASARRQATPPAFAGLVPASQASVGSPPPGTTGNTPSPDQVLQNGSNGFDPVAPRRKARTEALEPRVYSHNAGSEETRRSSDGDKEGQKTAILVTGSLDGTVKIWDVESGDEITTLFGHIEGVWAVDIDALRVASASHDRTVKVWDRESGNCVHTFTGHRGAVTSLQLSDDMIVSGSDDGDVMVWSFAPHAAPLTPGIPA